MSIRSDSDTAVSFHGSWREFAPIALSNILLSIVTLGFYRFWGITRERRYFWSNTQFIDDRLEWAGTGRELFVGFIGVIILLLIPLLALQFGIQALILRDLKAAAVLVGLLAYGALIYLIGIATFRALRYRLSRTRWHGIRGGSDQAGLRYGLSYIWKTLAGAIPLGLLIPRASMSLWKERWEAMSFGPYEFVSTPDWKRVMKRYALLYLVPILAVIGGAITAAASVGSGSGAFMVFVVLLLSAYLILPFIALGYYAAYLREVVGTLSMSSLNFHFAARTKQWILLYLGNAAIYLIAASIAFLLVILVTGISLEKLFNPAQPAMVSPMASLALFIAIILPLAFVSPFIRYRNWAFFIDHLEVTGEISLSSLSQSTSNTQSHGEGLLEALDIGAI